MKYNHLECYMLYIYYNLFMLQFTQSCLLEFIPIIHRKYSECDDFNNKFL